MKNYLVLGKYNNIYGEFDTFEEAQKYVDEFEPSYENWLIFTKEEYEEEKEELSNLRYY